MIEDIKTLSEATGIMDTKLLTSFVQDFFQFCAKGIERIELCIKRGDNENILIHSQHIFSAAERLHLDEIQQASLSLAKAAESKETGKYSSLHKDLSSALESTKKSLKI